MARLALLLPTCAAGPAVNYTAMVRNSPLTFSAKWQPDISATNTTKGDVVTASLAFVF
jgi:hypothetical protein